MLSLLFVVARGLLSSCGAWAPERVGSVVCKHEGSLLEARGLSCPAACGILVPRSGIEPTGPALEGGCFTTGPPGKSLSMSGNQDLPPKHRGYNTTHFILLIS